MHDITTYKFFVLQSGPCVYFVHIIIGEFAKYYFYHDINIILQLHYFRLTKRFQRDFINIFGAIGAIGAIDSCCAIVYIKQPFTCLLRPQLLQGPYFIELEKIVMLRKKRKKKSFNNTKPKNWTYSYFSSGY